MNRLPVHPWLALVLSSVSCGGGVQPAASPEAPRAQNYIDSVAPMSAESPSVAHLAPGMTSQTESPSEAAHSQAAPTWSWVFERYFAVGTEGSCGRSRACHAPDMTQASTAYDWLERRGYIAGTQSPIASAANSCLRWFGGNMPPRGKPNAEAAQAVSAWVAAGALND